MFKIRAPQMNALGAAQWSLLADRMQQHLRDTLPEDYKQLGARRASDLADRTVEEGRKYGFYTELEFFRLFNVFFLLGEPLSREPWVYEILDDFYRQPVEKLKALEQECRNRGKWS